MDGVDEAADELAMRVISDTLVITQLLADLCQQYGNLRPPTIRGELKKAFKRMDPHVSITLKIEKQFNLLIRVQSRLGQKTSFRNQDTKSEDADNNEEPCALRGVHSPDNLICQAIPYSFIALPNYNTSFTHLPNNLS